MLLTVLWSLYNLDRQAEQSERLVATGISVAGKNRELADEVGEMERVARQYAVLNNNESLTLLRQDSAKINDTIDSMMPLAEKAGAIPLARSVRIAVQRVVQTLRQDTVTPDMANEVVDEFVEIRRRVTELSTILSNQIDLELANLQASARRAQQIAAWQAVALIPGTIGLVVVFTFLVARPIRQIDRAIEQLGQSGFSKPIAIKGPRDLEALGRQLEWLRTRLLELAQEKNRFLRHMSHELKTPLANIREGTELLLDGAVGELDKNQREVTDILRVNGLKLQQLIENLLSFSAWQAKSETLNLVEFPIKALVTSVVKAQRLALTAAEINLKLEVGDFVVAADHDKLRAVLDNLMSNAIKFTPKGGTIAIMARSAADSFVLEFADTGPGIPENERPRIFDAFFQGQREQGGQVAGTGIGLSVVMECVEAHDGVVELLAESPFSGAHFKIHVPQHREPLEPRIAANG